MVTWGHPDTTGSPKIDAFLSSEHLETANGQDQYTETLLKLSTLGITYERPTLSKEYRKTRKDFGLRADKHLYCCPQTLFKFHPEFDLVLGEILRVNPLAELVLLERRLQEWTHRLFRRTLPNADQRVRFLPAMAREDFLSLLSLSDVVLDPIHFGGVNSSMEACLSSILHKCEERNSLSAMTRSHQKLSTHQPASSMWRQVCWHGLSPYCNRIHS